MSTAAYRLIDFVQLDASDLRHVAFELDVDHAQADRAYRVEGVFDVAENSFDELRVTAEWSSDLIERPVVDPSLNLQTARFEPATRRACDRAFVRNRAVRRLCREVERYVECEDDIVDMFFEAMRKEERATDPR